MTASSIVLVVRRGYEDEPGLTRAHAMLLSSIRPWQTKDILMPEIDVEAIKAEVEDKRATYVILLSVSLTSIDFRRLDGIPAYFAFSDAEEGSEWHKTASAPD